MLAAPARSGCVFRRSATCRGLRTVALVVLLQDVENVRLKRLVADFTLDKTMLQDVPSKKW